MKIWSFLFLSFLGLSQFTQAQSIRFAFQGDSTTIPLVRDSLRGISGVEHVMPADEWHLVSDRGPHFVFGPIQKSTDFSKAANLRSFTRTPYWYESIRYRASDSTYFFTDEHNAFTSVQYYKAGSKEPKVILKIPLPSRNKGLEALAVTPAGALWIAPETGWEGESAMNQDSVTFFRLRNPTSADASTERFRYKIDRCSFARSEERLGGISELIAVDETQLLVLERCYDATPGQQRVTAHVYAVTIDEKNHTLHKEVAYDFSQFPGQVCNLECMAWLDAQHQTLVIVGDDNFSGKRSERSQVIFLKRQ